MLRSQHKNAMSLQESSSSTTVGHDKCNIAEAQDKDFKTAIEIYVQVP